MHLIKSRSLKFFTYFIITVLLLLFILILSLKFIVPLFVEKSLRTLSESNNLVITVKKAEFNLLKGLKLQKLKLGSGENQSLSIEEIYVKPEYISSLKEKKFFFKNINLNKSSLNISKESIEVLKKLFPEKEKEEESKKMNFFIKNIHFDRLSISENEKPYLNLNKLNIDWNQIDEDNFLFVIKSLLSKDDENSSELTGKIYLNQKEKEAKVDLKAGNLEKLLGSQYLNIPSNLNAHAVVNINYLSNIKTEGEITFKQNPIISNNSEDIGNVSFNTVYESGEGDLTVERIVLSINDFLNLKTYGSVNGLTNDMEFNISSVLEIENLGKIAKWVQVLNEGELKGNLETTMISLEGSEKKNNVQLIIDGSLKNISYIKDKSGIEKINSDFSIKKRLSEKETHIQASLDAGSIN
ncbi:MAG: hypothetical protein ACRENO_00840, partial [Thermodesulfobacteriota bacterium]